MKLARLAILIIGVGSAVAAAGCGGKRDAQRHGAENETTAPLEPTPDTTPVAALRTPAGLVLKIEEAPALTPTPRGAPSAEPTKAAP